jgi:gluconolactonase
LKIFHRVLWGIICCGFSLSAANAQVIAPGATLVKLADGFEFTEGPAVDRMGNVFFTDQPNDRILRWGIDGSLSTFLTPSGRSNGLYFDWDGDLLACADENNQLWSIDPSGKITVLCRSFEGRLLNGPNDLWVRPDGGIYFTDPFYKRPYWSADRKMEQDGQHVYFLSADRQKLTRVSSDLMQPNGIIGTPNGRLLYVADIGANTTYSFSIQPDGNLTDRRFFCGWGSDGMTIDQAGNLYLTGQGVTVFNRAGEQTEQIFVPESWTGNVTFGGADRRTLFITASKGLYSIRMTVRGVDQIPFRRQYRWSAPSPRRIR